MSKLRLHLDADVSTRAVLKTLLQRGHDVTRTPNEWIAENAHDEEQLRQASLRGRCIVTFNVRDFVPLARKYPNHSGILLGHQGEWTMPALMAVLDRILTETEAEDWVGQVRWLNDWRVR